MEVSPSTLLVVLVCTGYYSKGIEFDSRSSTIVGSVGKNKAQMAIGTAQVNGLTGYRLVHIGIRNLQITYLRPVLSIVTTQDVHTDDMTVSAVLTTCNIHLDKTGNRFVKSYLQIGRLEVLLMIVAVPEGIGIAIGSVFDMLTLARIGSIGRQLRSIGNQWLASLISSAHIKCHRHILLHL